MTGADALAELFARIGDSLNGVAYISEEELANWPKSAVVAFERAGMLKPASPATSAICDGCDRQCPMAIEIANHAGQPVASIFCDKLEHAARIDVPLDRLRRRQASGRALAGYLTKALGIPDVSPGFAETKTWLVGGLRDKRSARVELHGSNVLTLKLAGHEVPLAGVLTFQGRTLRLDRRRLVECVNSPLAGGGSGESAEQRRQAIARRCEALFLGGCRNFRKVVADEYGIKVSTLRDILKRAGFSTRGVPKPKKV